MCDYNHESKKTLASLPVPLARLPGHLGKPAYRPLLKAVASGRVRLGRDLWDGRPLPAGSLECGHFMSPANFEHALARMAAKPHRCQWCGQRLPPGLTREHQLPHNHREEQRHHFHPRCWQARLLAVAAIFGHVRPQQLLTRHAAFKRWFTVRETLTWTVRKVFTVNTHSQARRHRWWHRRAKWTSKPTRSRGWIVTRRQGS